MEDDSQTQADPTLCNDTDRWHLAVTLSSRGMQGWLADAFVPNERPRLLTRPMPATATVGSDLLRRIENAVYDNPMVLDDYRADLIIETNDILAAPAIIADDDMNAAEIFSQVFEMTDSGDIFTDIVGDVCIIHCLAPGLKPFLMRTFPGARVRSHFAVLMRYWLSVQRGTERTYVHLRPGYADMAAFSGDRLLCAGIHPTGNSQDAVYFAMHMARNAGLADDSPFIFSGTPDAKAEAIRLMHGYEASTMSLPLPACDTDKDMPLPVALTLKN